MIIFKCDFCGEKFRVVKGTRSSFSRQWKYEVKSNGKKLKHEIFDDDDPCSFCEEKAEIASEEKLKQIKREGS